MTSSSLIPIRVDVTCQDKSLRLVDTLLLDPTVLPIPLDPTSSTSIEDTLFQNAQYLSNELLADAEVQGMGRTVRHFTGRLDLWKMEMLELLIDNILPQLRAAVLTMPSSSSISTSTSHTTTNQATTNTSQQNKHISIRMLIHGIRIHDDFWYDPTVDGDVSPLQIATVMGRDLNLPEEAVVALAIDIAEQAAGLKMEQDTSTTPLDNEGAPFAMSSSSDNNKNNNVTAAWELESSVHITNVAHVVAFHR